MRWVSVGIQPRDLRQRALCRPHDEAAHLGHVDLDLQQNKYCVNCVTLQRAFFFFKKRFVSTIYCTHFAGDFGAALVVGGSGYAVQRLSFVVVHKAPEVLEALGH